jgi:predicted phosphodiesterase
MRIVCISDTHNLHEQISPPDGDILIHAGDCTENGTIAEAQSFLAWFSSQPHAAKIFVPGNHDDPFAQPRTLATLRRSFPNVRVLIDQELQLRGLRAYGAPWLPGVASEPEHFWIRANSSALHEKWDAIPDDTAILVTHGPPYNILDTRAASISATRPSRTGSRSWPIYNCTSLASASIIRNLCGKPSDVRERRLLRFRRPGFSRANRYSRERGN